MTRALDTLAKDSMAGSRSAERHVLCLVDRVIEPLVRLQWDELHNTAGSDRPGETTVSNLPFIPKPMQRAKADRQKRRK